MDDVSKRLEDLLAQVGEIEQSQDEQLKKMIASNIQRPSGYDD